MCENHEAGSLALTSCRLSRNWLLVVCSVYQDAFLRAAARLEKYCCSEWDEEEKLALSVHCQCRLSLLGCSALRDTDVPSACVTSLLLL